MKKINGFNVMIGILILIIFIVISVMAYKAAYLKNQNVDNIIAVDSGSNQKLDVPKSNLVTKDINVQKDIQGDKATLSINVKLPKINSKSKAAEDINEKIQMVYDNLYIYANKIEQNEKLNIDYTYDYNDDKNELTIRIKEQKGINGNVTDLEYIYICKIK